MGFLSALGSVAGSLAGSAGSLVGSFLNYNLGRRQLSYQKSIDTQNFENQEREFQYQKYLNNNQIQIQSADAQKAGINPMAMNSTSLSSANYSNVNSGAQAPQIDLGSLLQAGIAIDENKKARDISESQLSSQEAMQAKQIASNEYIAKLNADNQRRIAMMNNSQSGINAQTSASASMYGANKNFEGVRESNRTNKEIAMDKLNETAYEYDKNYEMARQKFINQSKQDSLAQVKSAYEHWYLLRYHKSPSGSGGTISNIMDLLDTAVLRGYDTYDNFIKNFNPKHSTEEEKFLYWYIKNGFAIPNGSFDSSVRRRN